MLYDRKLQVCLTMKIETEVCLNMKIETAMKIETVSMLNYENRNCNYA